MELRRLAILLVLFSATLCLVQCHPPVPTPVAPGDGNHEGRPGTGTEQNR